MLRALLQSLWVRRPSRHYLFIVSHETTVAPLGHGQLGGDGRWARLDAEPYPKVGRSAPYGRGVPDRVMRRCLDRSTRRLAGTPRVIVALACAGGIAAVASVGVAHGATRSHLSHQAFRYFQPRVVDRRDSRPLVIVPEPPILPTGTGQGDTDSPSFSVLLQGSSGSILHCKLDGQAVGCGTPTPSCDGTVCATFTAPGQSDGQHVLDVTDIDAAGYTLDENVYVVTVVLAPPDTVNLELDDSMDPPRSALGPKFSFAAAGVNPALVDSAQCSLEPLGSPATWAPCVPYQGYDADEDFQYTASLPDDHADYLFQARVIDAFGRVDPTPASLVYDPVPCGLQVAAPPTVKALVRSGLTLTVQCTGAPSAALSFYLLTGHGKDRGSDGLPAHAVPLAPGERITGGLPSFTARRRIKPTNLLKLEVGNVRRARSLRVELIVAPTGSAGNYDPLPDEVTVSVRNLTRSAHGQPRGR